MATSKLVSELVINQLTAAQYWQAKENGEIKADELYLIIPEKPKAVDAYSKEESDARFATKDALAGKLQGVRFENISRPNRPWPTIMHVDNPLGVMISGGPLQGYVSNSDASERYQPKGDYATKADLAQLGGGGPSGTWLAPSGGSLWKIPDAANVIKITWAGVDVYFKVKQGGVIRLNFIVVPSSEKTMVKLKNAEISFNYEAESPAFRSLRETLVSFGSETSLKELAISWSPEINARAANVDLTQG